MADLRPVVYICNKSHHDFRPAYAWGTPVFLTEGRLEIYDIGGMYRACAKHMVRSRPDDLVLQTSLPVLFAVACGFQIHRHGFVNILLYSKGEYIKREISYHEVPRCLTIPRSSLP